jgi:histidyl-tRNA synthetase
MKINNIRGTNDIFGEKLDAFQFIENTARNISKNYMFTEIKTPIIEYTDLFIRNLGETSDVVNKEIYTFLDKSNDNICLRPEFTAAIVRAFVDKFQHLPLPVKFFSVGPLFRYERPQKGRYRQFHQVNFEIIGIKSDDSDLELILLAISFLKKLGINFSLEINSLGCDISRANYKNSLVNYLKDYKNELSSDSLNRLEKNPLRILDSKDEKDKQIIENAPKISQFYTEKSQEVLSSLCEKLKNLGIDFIINEKLVRGLDYYSEIIFEFKNSSLGAQNTILAGGRYENLVENLGGQKLASTGFAAGIERLMEIVKINQENTRRIISIVPIGEKAEQKAIEIAYSLRSHNFIVDLQYNTSFKSRMKKAENSEFSVIFGEEEISNDLVNVKNMQTGKQEKINSSSLITFLLKSNYEINR